MPKPTPTIATPAPRGLKAHLRTAFLAGAFALIPVVVTVVVVLYVEQLTRRPLQALGLDVPGLGVVVALGLMYLCGLFVTSVIGRWVVRAFDRVLSRLPLLRELYDAWKQVSFTPGGGEGIYAKVVLVPCEESGRLRQLAFSTGEPIPGAGGLFCVFIPNSPNPVMGRVAFVDAADVTLLDMSIEEAFKVLLSSGNYVPEAVARAGARPKDLGFPVVVVEG